MRLFALLVLTWYDWHLLVATFDLFASALPVLYALTNSQALPSAFLVLAWCYWRLVRLTCELFCFRCRITLRERYLARSPRFGSDSPVETGTRSFIHAHW